MMAPCPSCALPVERTGPNRGHCRACAEALHKRCASHGHTLPGCPRCMETNYGGRKRLAEGRTFAQGWSPQP